ncbi:S9 family peptidase [Rothia terrae]|uniref:S9 family peptidase n=1 Tax=Rothia terrae TaxID=396015 RepID=UPI0014466EA9|nr:S9 family peptidase [Rothia terrae]NKZ33817.1 S9 family peptidase [Rothia terrae]
MSSPHPPQPKRVSSVRSFHGDSFTDSYEWLRDKENPEVIDYLTAENTFTEQVTAHQQSLREAIFKEIKERTLETDLSVPQRKGNWWYYSRSVEGEQYPVLCRVPARTDGTDTENFTPPTIEPGSTIAHETVLLDCNKFAKNLPFFSLGSFSPAEDGSIIAFSVDASGDERFTQHFYDCASQTILNETIDNVFAGSFLTPDATSLIYTVADDSWRPYQVRRHTLGSSAKNDTVLFDEPDVTMWLGAEISADKSALLIDSGNSEFSEIYVVPFAELDTFNNSATPVIARSQGVQYSVEPVTINDQNYLLICHNFEAVNSELVLAPYPASEDFNVYRAQWKSVMSHRDDIRVEGATLSATHLVVSARVNTTSRLFFSPLPQLQELVSFGHAPVFFEPAGFDDELYTCSLSSAGADSPVVRFNYEAWVTPTRVYDFFPATNQLILRKETPVLGNFSPANYTAYRLWATSNDGTSIPLSVMHRVDLDMTVPHPILQYGYGSYEASMDPVFGITRLSLLDRGVIFVVAHIRGGGELGRNWYLKGKKLHKKNTFTDFVATTDFLASQEWVDEKRIAIMGGSAGGLLIGATLNLAPEKYCAAVAQVPFVDALTTILDPELPLSALEWEEWGNPIESSEVYEYMKSYTPYENIRPVVYPPIAAVTSLNDTRVFYVEPAKWVAQLRHTIDATSPTPLLKIEMDGGHGGGSGRYTRWHEIAWDYAFLLTYLSPLAVDTKA